MSKEVKSEGHFRVLDEINPAVEWTEIRKHILLYMIGRKMEGKSEDDVVGETKYLIDRLRTAVENGSFKEQMEKTEASLKKMDESLWRVGKNE